jgi:MFS family permease
MAVVSSLGAPLIPSIARADGVSLSTGEWLLTAALLTGALATPALGRLADGPSKRRVIEIVLVVVTVGCVLSAVSTNFAVMVIGRGLQGVGLALLPVTMAMAHSELPPHRVGRAVAALSVTVAVGVGLGYPITGLIAEVLGFRAAFWFGAIAVGAAVPFVIAILPKRSNSPARRFDFGGMMTLGPAVVGISIVLSEGGDWGWTSPASVVIATCSATLIAVWVRHELRVTDPLIDVRQVRNRSVLTADVSGFLIALAMYLFLPIIIEFVQVPSTSGYGFGASVAVAGLVFVPLSIGSFVATRVQVLYEQRFGTRSMIPFGSAVFAASTLFFAIEHRALWEAFVAAGFAGIGVGFTFAAMPGFILRAVAPTETGSATGFYQVLRSVGLSVGSALAAALLTAYTHPGQTFPTAQGFRVTLLSGSVLCAAAAVISYLLPGRTAQQMSNPSPEVTEIRPKRAKVPAVGVVLNGEASPMRPGLSNS